MAKNHRSPNDLAIADQRVVDLDPIALSGSTIAIEAKLEVVAKNIVDMGLVIFAADSIQRPAVKGSELEILVIEIVLFFETNALVSLHSTASAVHSWCRSTGASVQPTIAISKTQSIRCMPTPTRAALDPIYDPH